MRFPVVIAAILLLTAVTAGGCGSSNTGSREAGKKVEQKLQAGWNQYKFQSEPIMAQQLKAFIRSRPTLTQVGAIEAAFLYAQELDIQQRLAPGDESKLIRDMERDFPSTKKILDKEVAHS